MKKLKFVIVIALASNFPGVMIRWQYNSPKWELPGDNCPRWELPGGNCPRWEFSGGQLSRGNCPRTAETYLELSQTSKMKLFA